MKFPTINRTSILAGTAITLLVTGGVFAYSRTLPKSVDQGTTQPSSSTPSPSSSPSASPEPSVTPVAQSTPTTSPTPIPTPSKFFTLDGDTTSDGVQLDWDVAGFDVSHGFKLIIGDSAGNVTANYKLIASPTARSARWKVGDGQLGFFRVCGFYQATNNGVSGVTDCSNTIALETNNVAAETSGSITLLPSTSNGGFHWTVEGYAPYGFRLVWATHANPVYPTDQSQTYPAVWSNASSGSIPNVPGTWHVKACMITADQGCANYSNEKTITIP